MTPRAAPLSPELRRAAIVEAVTPVVLTRGAEVTTREIATAAGVAEGTIFKVFDSKEAVVEAVVEHLLDPADTCAEIVAAEPADLTEACRGTIAVLQRRIREITTVFMTLRLPRPGRPGPGDADADGPDHTRHEVHRARNEQLLTAVATTLAPWQHQLRLPAREVASLLTALAFATSHPALGEGGVREPDDLTAVLLHGLLQPTRDGVQTARPAQRAQTDHSHPANAPEARC